MLLTIGRPEKSTQNYLYLELGNLMANEYIFENQKHIKQAGAELCQELKSAQFSKIQAEINNNKTNRTFLSYHTGGGDGGRPSHPENSRVKIVLGCCQYC